MTFATFELRLLVWILFAWLVLVLVAFSLEVGVWPVPVVAWSLARRLRRLRRARRRALDGGRVAVV